MSTDQLERIADALESIVGLLKVVVDPAKRTLRLEDVERAKVYSTHLGEKLRVDQSTEQR